MDGASSTAAAAAVAFSLRRMMPMLFRIMCRPYAFGNVRLSAFSKTLRASA
jgi:hypothetical protein